jgi:hypothetical protein
MADIDDILFDIMDLKREEPKLWDFTTHHTTPVVISDVIEKVSSLYLKQKNNSSIYDPALGTGSLLLKVLDKNNKKIGYGYGQEINNQTFQVAVDLAKRAKMDDKVDYRNCDSLVGPEFRNGEQLIQFDMIVSSLPLGLRFNSEPFIKSKFSNNKHGDILFFEHILASMNNEGVAVIACNLALTFSGVHKTFRDHLLENDLLEAVVELPERLYHGTQISPCLYILNKNKRDLAKGKVLLINATADSFILPKGSNFKTIDKLLKCLDGFESINQYSTTVSVSDFLSGDVLSIKPSSSLDTSKYYPLIEQISGNYNFHTLKELSSSIISFDNKNGGPEEDTNALYINEMRKYDIQDSLSDLFDKGRYYQVVLDNEVVLVKYLKTLFRTDFGQHILRWRSSSPILRGRISKSELENVEVPVPDLKTQDQFVGNYETLQAIYSELESIKENEFSILSSHSNFMNILSKISVGSSGESVEVSELREKIRHGESTTLEFKESYSMNMKGDNKGSPNKNVEISTLKNIVGFLNSEFGGEILIGVNDEGEVNGIDEELKKLRRGSKDSYLLHIENGIKDRIGSDFSTSYVDVKILEHNGKNICRIKCSPSKDPCHLNEEDFYVRSGPSSTKLVGPKYLRYVRRRFPLK